MNIFFWLGIFAISLLALVKGGDFLIRGAEHVGRYFKLPSFVIGALIVGVGTSLPELASSIAATIAGENEIVISNAVGSNIANILLVAGLAAIVGKRIVSTKNLVDLEIPMLVITTGLFLGAAYDQVVTQFEALLLVVAFVIYVSYLLVHPDESGSNEDAVDEVSKLSWKDYGMVIGGGILLSIGASYLIKSVIGIATLLDVTTGVVAISAVAVGTSLPEIIVSVTAVLRGKTDMAFGNVFGSNMFNILMLVGFVGSFQILDIDPVTYMIGLPIFGIVTVMFLVSATSKKISRWEGMLFLLVYVFFLSKIFGFA